MYSSRIIMIHPLIVGTKFTSTGIFYCQVIILLEVITYIILFQHLYIHNRKMENRPLGLSKETMKRRRRQNVVTFFGEFASFVIESIFGMILQLMIVYHDKNNFNGFVPFLGIFAQAILTITFFLASPELK